jgi:dipeptidyl aminopeptidase/acylaminoacyl peptidase
MRTRTLTGLIVFAIVALSLSVAPAAAQQGDVKRALTHDDYDAWQSIRGQKISSDGLWVLYTAALQEGDGELVVRHVESGREYRHPRGSGAEFTADVQHVVFLIDPAEADTKAAKKDKTKAEDMPKKALGVMDLADGSVETVDRVKSFELAEDVGGWVAYLHEGPTSEQKKAAEEAKKAEQPAEEPEAEEEGGEEAEEEDEDDEDDEKKDYGTTLTLRSLSDGSEWNAASVLEYLLTKDASYLVYTVSSEDEPAADGIYAYGPANASSLTVIAGEGNYKRLAMDEEGTKLAFVTDRDDYAADTPTFNLYGWNLESGGATLWVSHGGTSGFPAGMAVSDKSDLSFNDSGSVVLFGIKEIPEPEPEEDEDDEEKAVFDLWHWNDPYPQPQQLVMQERVENNTWESVYHIDSEQFVKLADEVAPDVWLSADGSLAWAQTNVPHTKKVSYYGTFNDIYVIDPETGERTLAVEGIFRGAQLSPGGKFLTWFGMDDYDWYVYDIAQGTTTNITADLDVRFDREDWDTPQAAGSYGLAGWTDDDASVLVYDRYDIWEIAPDGSGPRMITEGYGRANDLSFRYRRLDPEEESIDPAGRVLLAATNEDTMATGFWWDSVAGTTAPSEIIMVDMRFGAPVKAEGADVLMYTQSRFDEYPDLWVSGMDFVGKRVSHLGAQVDPFLWGTAELRDFYSSDGIPLKGILIKPEDFDPNEEYPLMVYIYETLHQGLHSFRNPSPGTSVNTSYYASNGYVIWMPDIEYTTGYPGKDALKCVLPGVNMLLAEGYIDPARVGIQGHSWGGYQIAYMITQTNVFAAVESGAPVSNMTSAYGGIRWQSGMVRQFQYEVTQSRLGASLWEVPLRYIENSPIFWADKIQTPILMIHNDEDGAVPWYQGIELMMALRRLERPAWMLNYNGEAHGLRQRPNQKDWTIRMQQFFDHYLKGAEAPAWMTEGILAWEKGKTEK